MPDDRVRSIVAPSLMLRSSKTTSRPYRCLSAENRQPKRTSPPAVKTKTGTGVKPASKAVVGAGSSAELAALRAECATLKAQLAALEVRQSEIANRLAWALEALDDILGGDK